MRWANHPLQATVAGDFVFMVIMVENSLAKCNKWNTYFKPKESYVWQALYAISKVRSIEEQGWKSIQKYSPK